MMMDLEATATKVCFSAGHGIVEAAMASQRWQNKYPPIPFSVAQSCGEYVPRTSPMSTIHDKRMRSERRVFQFSTHCKALLLGVQHLVFGLQWTEILNRNCKYTYARNEEYQCTLTLANGSRLVHCE